MDGYTTVARLRGQPRRPVIPIIVLTGRTDPLTAPSQGVGASAHLTKPFSPRRLVSGSGELVGGRACELAPGRRRPAERELITRRSSRGAGAPPMGRAPARRDPVVMGAITQEQLTWGLLEALHIPYVEFADEVVDLDVARHCPRTSSAATRRCPIIRAAGRDDRHPGRPDQPPGGHRAGGHDRGAGDDGHGLARHGPPHARQGLSPRAGDPGAGALRRGERRRDAVGRDRPGRGVPGVRPPPRRAARERHRDPRRAAPARRPGPQPDRRLPGRAGAAAAEPARPRHLPAPGPGRTARRELALPGQGADPARGAGRRAGVPLLPDPERRGGDRASRAPGTPGADPGEPGARPGGPRGAGRAGERRGGGSSS